MIKKIQVIFLPILLFYFSSSAQKWDLRKAVEYAIQHNITVKQTDLQSRYTELALKQNIASQIPSMNFNSNLGYRFGRSENPTTGVLEDNNFLNAGLNLSTQVTLFNWFSKKNTIEANKLSLEADKAQIRKVQDDIALNVAAAYLQILLTKGQANISRIQVLQTKSQLENTRKQVEVGKLPELNAAQLEAQLATDSSNLVTADVNVKQAELLLKALLNLDAAVDFEVETPPIEQIPLENLGDLQPETVYAQALINLSRLKVNELRLKSALKSVDAAKGMMFPTISAYAGLGSNYVNIKFPETQFGPKAATGATVNISGVDYIIEAPTFIIVGEKAVPLGRQFRNNFGQNIGISLSVPIFNSRTYRTNWERSKLDVAQYELQKELDNQSLKQDIYKAHTDAVAAIEKFNAGKKSVQTSERAFDFSQKRYDLGLLSIYDLLNSQNTMLRARVELLYAQHDFVFKMKLLEFYKGQGLKL